MADIIYVQSAKGGAGATSVCVGAGLALAADGEKTLIVDGSDCADGLYMCGLYGLNVYTLADAESGACRVKQAILQHPKGENLYILPAAGCKDENYAAKAVKEIEGLFDRILCDSTAAAACKRAILVTEPYAPSLNGAARRLADIVDRGIRETGIVVNKVNGGLVYDGRIMPPRDIAALLRTRLAGVIPEDLELPLGKVKRQTKKAYAMCAANLEGKNEEVYSVTGAFSGFGGGMKRYLRRKL